MKKILIIIAIFFVSAMLKAQDSNFRLGLTLAPSVNFNKHEYKNQDGKWVRDKEGTGGLGWKGGLLADYNFAGNYNFHSGFLIHSKSFDGKNMDMTVTTIEIPLALKLRTKEVSDNVHITGFFGGTFDLNVAANRKDENGDVVNAMDLLNNFGMSFMAGAGAEYDLDFGSIGLGLSYHLGFTDVAKSDTSKINPKHLSIDLVFYF